MPPRAISRQRVSLSLTEFIQLKPWRCSLTAMLASTNPVAQGLWSVRARSGEFSIMRFPCTMPATGIDKTTTAVPVLRYRDLPAALEWLCRTLGFEKHLVVTSEDGSVRLAQLSLGNAMIMLAPVRNSELDKLMVQPDEVGGAETQLIYFFVADIAAHYARAMAEGAEIVLDKEDKCHPNRTYACRDLEGHIWSFGKYDPRKPSTDRSAIHGGTRYSFVLRALSVSLSVALISSVAAISWAYSVNPKLLSELETSPLTGAPSKVATNRVEDPLEPERIAREKAELAARLASEQLARVLMRESEEKTANRKLLQALTEARSARAEAERVSEHALAQLIRLQSDRDAAERSAEEALLQLNLERHARSAAETAITGERRQVARERRARDAAERASRELETRLARERSSRKEPAKPSQGGLFGIQ